MDYTIFDNLPDSIVFTKMSGEIIYCNVAFSILVNIPAERIIKKRTHLNTVTKGIWIDPQELNFDSEIEPSRIFAHRERARL